MAHCVSNVFAICQMLKRMQPSLRKGRALSSLTLWMLHISSQSTACSARAAMALTIGGCPVAKGKGIAKQVEEDGGDRCVDEGLQRHACTGS